MSDELHDAMMNYDPEGWERSQRALAKAKAELERRGCAEDDPAYMDELWKVLPAFINLERIGEQLEGLHYGVVNEVYQLAGELNIETTFAFKLASEYLNDERKWLKIEKRSTKKAVRR